MRLLLALATLFTINAQALETSYLKIKEPYGWSCEQRQAVWLCRSLNKLEKKEAFLIIKAKLAGRTDNNASFYESLRAPLPLANSSGSNAMSKVYSVKKININNQTWVQGQHLNSVAQNYFTEYLVTVSGDLAIGLEFTYHQSRYNKYKGVFDILVKNLTLVDNVASSSPKITMPKQKLPTAFSIKAKTPNEKANSIIPTIKISRTMQILVYIGLGIFIILGAMLIRQKL